jgi:hypothetical protein
MSVADEVYAGVLLVAVGLSLLVLLVLRFVSKAPLFPEDVLKIPRFRSNGYDELPTVVENGSVGQKEKPSFALEPLKGWRRRLGILQEAVLISLVVLHALTLVLNGATLLRIVFVVYWVVISVKNAYRRLSFSSITPFDFYLRYIDIRFTIFPVLWVSFHCSISCKSIFSHPFYNRQDFWPYPISRIGKFKRS